MDLKKSFCWRSNLSNFIISYRPDLKRACDTRGLTYKKAVIR